MVETTNNQNGNNITPSTTSFVPQQSAHACKPGCRYTVLIVVITVVCTIIAEVIIVFALASWAVGRFMSAVQNEMNTSTISSVSNTKNSKGSTVLTSEQKKLLNQLGINPADIPPEDMVKVVCVENALGADRIKAIADGKVTPGFTDLYKVKSCF